MNSLIGVFGGTFDPVHKGHLAIVIQLLKTLPFTELRMVPCHLPVHRKQPGASEQDRLTMLKLATDSLNNPKLVIDDIEIRRGGHSYMIDTLSTYQQRYTDNHSLALIMGYDAWLGFQQWHKWQDILTTAHIILIHRPEIELPTTGPLAELLIQHQTTDSQQLLTEKAGKILLQAHYQFTISATEVRNALKQQADLRKLLPEKVLQYIIERNLYCQ